MAHPRAVVETTRGCVDLGASYLTKGSIMLQKISRGEVQNNTSLGGSLQKAFARPEVRNFISVPDEFCWADSMSAALALKSLLVESGVPPQSVRLAAICGAVGDDLTPISATCTVEYAGNTYCLDAFGVSSVSEAMFRTDLLGPPIGEPCIVWEGDDTWAASVENSSFAQVKINEVSALKDALEVFINFRITDFLSGVKVQATSNTVVSRSPM